MPTTPSETAARLSTAAGAEYLADGVVFAEGREGHIVMMNSRAEKVTGLSFADLRGMPIREALAFQDRNGNCWWDVASPWEGLNIRTGHRERLLILPNGRECLLTARYVRARHLGPVVAIILGLRDAEARRRVEADHAALISTVAHELRSPLTGVKGFSSTLLRRWERFNDDQKRLMVETIDTDADRVTRLITELLDVSRIDSGRLRIHVQQVSARTVFGRHVERQVASGRERECFVAVVDPDVDEVWADPDRLDQVLANLLENAFRHGGSNVTLRAVPSSDEGHDGVEITVGDDGPGVPPSQREIVFSRFWHGHAPGSTGLGLYIVRGLVEAHGGWVRIEDSPSGGALLRMFFPTPPGD